MEQIKSADFLFLGTYPGVVDSKCRASIPADFRRSLEECGENELIFSPGAENFINAFPRKVYNRFWRNVDPLDDSFNEEDSLAADIALHGASNRKPVDSQGRVTLPPAVFERTGIQRDIVFIGRRNHFIIWDKTGYEAFIKEKGITPGEAWKKHRKTKE